MKRKNIYIYTGLVIINIALFAGLLFILAGNKQKANDTTPVPIKEISLSQVQAHNTISSCWTIVGSKVYDLTPYISKNPNSEAFIKACGIDGTDVLLPKDQLEQNSKTNKILEAYFIGIIAP